MQVVAEADNQEEQEVLVEAEADNQEEQEEAEADNQEEQDVLVEAEADNQVLQAIKDKQEVGVVEEVDSHMLKVQVVLLVKADQVVKLKDKTNQ